MMSSLSSISDLALYFLFHLCLFQSGVFMGTKLLVRLSFGIDGLKEVAMKLAVRSEDESISDVIHEIIGSV